MSWWPWKKREQRSTAQGYTAGITAAFQAGAEGGSDTAPLATAALEAAAGFYSRCMSAAMVEGAPDVTAALTPGVLGAHCPKPDSDAVRIIIASMFAVGGWSMLEPIGFAYAHGGPDPMGWTYSITSYGPTDSRA